MKGKMFNGISFSDNKNDYRPAKRSDRNQSEIIARTTDLQVESPTANRRPPRRVMWAHMQRVFNMFDSDSMVGYIFSDFIRIFPKTISHRLFPEVF